MTSSIDYSVATSEAIAAALGGQLKNIRLSRNITQAQLAAKAGVTTVTIGRLEKGLGTSLDTFIRVLLALDIQQNLAALLPDPTIRPMERISATGSERQRARPDATDEATTPWTWGDEEAENG